MSRRAVILAGGLGSRLRPYTVVLPKPLMPVGDFPILEVIIRQLAAGGFSHLTLAVNHQADIIRAFCGDGSKWGLRIDYSLETQPLSTMAPLKLISGLPEHFLVMNGDVLTDLDFGAFHDRHVAANCPFTIAASEREQVIDYGVLEASPEGMLTAFREKPRSSYLVSMGVYMVSRATVGQIPAGVKYGFDDLMLAMLSRGERVVVERRRDYWLDIGRVDDYMRAIEEFDGMKPRLLRNL